MSTVEEVPEYLNLHTVAQEAAEGTTSHITRICLAAEIVPTKKDAEGVEPLRVMLEGLCPKNTDDLPNSEDAPITGIIFEGATHIYWCVEAPLPTLLALFRKLKAPNITRRVHNFMVASVTDVTDRQFLRMHSVEHSITGQALASTDRVPLAVIIAQTNAFVRSIAHALYRRDAAQATTYLTQKRASAQEGWPTMSFVKAVMASAKHGMALPLKGFVEV